MDHKTNYEILMTSFVIGFIVFISGYVICLFLGNQDIDNITISILFLAAVISSFSYQMMICLKDIGKDKK